MEWLIGGLVAGAMLLALVFGVALARASRNVQHADERTIALTKLNDLKSPSGKPFYPEQNSLWELAEQLDDIDPRGS
jgi:hypothetical protein